MAYRETVTSEVIILGCGMEPGPDGTTVLMPGGVERADRFLQYYTDHPAAFSSREARVICSGGYGLLAAGIGRPEDDTVREGRVMADYLIGRGIPHRIIHTETESTSTLTNLAYSIDAGLIEPGRYSPDYPLGVVSHPHHLKRIRLLAGKMGLGHEALLLLPTEQQDDPRREFAYRVGYRALLMGASGTEALPRREKLPEVALGKVRQLLGSQKR